MNASPSQPVSPLRVEHSSGVTIARFKSSALLGAEIEVVGHELQRLIEDDPPPRIVVNLRGVVQMSSNMLAMLVTLNKAVADRRGCLVLCELTPQVRGLLGATRLEDRFAISDEEPDAVARCAQAATGSGES